jgi:preprotein translocase subunit SecF
LKNLKSKIIYLVFVFETRKPAAHLFFIFITTLLLFLGKYSVSLKYNIQPLFIHSFATALLIGVVVGTYSSIYVASSMILMLGISKEDLLPSEKEEQAVDNRP